MARRAGVTPALAVDSRRRAHHLTVTPRGPTPAAPARTLLALSVLGVVGAACPVPPCGCPPARFRARFYGSVTDPAGPIAAAIVRVRVLPATRCDFAAEHASAAETVTGSSGRFAITSYESFADTNCVRLVALRPNTATSESLVVDLRAHFYVEHQALPESVAVHFTFP